MTIYQSLEKDHRRIESLLEDLVEASQSDSDEWKSLLDELRNELIPHAHAEEAVFYNALREVDQGNGLVADSYREHAMAETEVRSLGAAKMIDANWTAMINKLRKDLQHHIEQEETKVFAAAQQVFNEEEARQLGEAFDKLKLEMAKDADSMVASTVDLIANLLPPRLVDSFRKGIGSRRKAA